MRGARIRDSSWFDDRRIIPADAGSTPLRGAISAIRPGIIPADAGSTQLGASGAFSSEDHPRRCGEHAHPENTLFHILGSSPQMRGAHLKSRCRKPYRGIIPADAGSTEDADGSRLTREDHPRRCGEHLIALVLIEMK